jgi:isopentenyl-diphosphate delta-isomerase
MSPPRASSARQAVNSAQAIERDRKAEHIQLALQEEMQLERNFFEDYFFEQCALPEIDFDEIDTSAEFLGRKLTSPLLISCMTGGTEDATRINRNLALGAQKTGIAVGVGSQRKALEDAATAESYRIRPFAPSVPLLANLGAVQLNYGYGLEECRRAVEMIEADALVFHLNALQEAIQPEGQRDFSRLLPRMGRIARELGVPVIAKEIGCGISGAVARELSGQGIRIIDTAGLGGTSWARIEAHRADELELGAAFADWGVPTPTAIRQLSQIPEITIIGSGGIRNGIDAAKAIALGADIVGMAYPFLRAADRSVDEVVRTIRRTVHELRICMFCLGAKTVGELRDARLHHRFAPSLSPRERL